MIRGGYRGLGPRPIRFRLLWPPNGHLPRWTACESWGCPPGGCSHHCDADRWSIHRGDCHWANVSYYSCILRTSMLYPPSTKLRLTCSQSEVAPPQIRGLLASMQQWMIGLGIMVAVSTCTYLLDTHTIQLTTPAMGRIWMLPPRRSLLLALPARLPSSPSLHLNLRHLVPPRIPTMAH